jgi:hypothetical protein
MPQTVGRLYLPNIAHLRLASLLGSIMDDAVSLRPVSYEAIMSHDRALTEWLDSLPPELNIDHYRLARSLASPQSDVRRLGVQSVVIRSAYYHVRFTLHRPYASRTRAENSEDQNEFDAREIAQSLEIAVNAADQLTSLVCQSRPDFVSIPILNVPGHTSWAALHIFSAAMFFSFQLVADPNQPGATLFRTNIARALEALCPAPGAPRAAKEYNILLALTPLYSEDYRDSLPTEREHIKRVVLGRVRSLAFPYHDHEGAPHVPGGVVAAAMESPASTASPLSPTGDNSIVPAVDYGPHLPPQPASRMSAQHSATLPPSLLQRRGSIDSMSGYAPLSTPYEPTTTTTPAEFTPQPMYSPMVPGAGGYHQLIPEAQTMWGASIGFQQNEWGQFLDMMQRPDPAARAAQAAHHP